MARSRPESLEHLRTILWQNRAEAGCEVCSLFRTESGFQLQGTALLEAEGLPVQARYQIECTAGWETRLVELDVWRGDHQELLALAADPGQSWWRNGAAMEGFQGLIDVDLGFTPSTNTLAIRRMKLKVGESGITTTVWVEFPALQVVRYPQRYTRTGEDEYLFEGLESGFRARLKVDEYGLVTDYEGLWASVSRVG